MTIIRSPRPEQNFLVISKSVVEDSQLSWAARGLLIYLLGKPDNWSISVKHLVKQATGTGTGRDAVYRLIDELMAAGYVGRKMVQSGAVYTVFDERDSVQLPEKHDPGIQFTGNQDTGIQFTGNQDTGFQEHNKNRVLTRTDVKQELTETRTDPKQSTPAALLADEGIPDQLVKDFLAVRKAKRAPLTKTALEGIRREAVKAGICLQQAITVCVERGWQGFKAEWYANERNPVPGGRRPSGTVQTKEELFEVKRQAGKMLFGEQYEPSR